MDGNCYGIFKTGFMHFFVFIEHAFNFESRFDGGKFKLKKWIARL